MAEKRMLSKVISVSEKVNTLPDIFDMLLFTWMIPHTDDLGRLPGSPAKIKALVAPMIDRSIADVKAALQNMCDQGLILWYESGGEKIIQILGHEKHQEGLKSRRSKFASPNSQLTSNNSYLDASESDIEELIVGMLENNSFVDGDEIIAVERQVRVENSYIDILAQGRSRRYLFEVKRQRLSNASVDQITKYRAMLKDSAVACILIGNGLSSNFDLSRCEAEGVNVLIYDDSLRVESKLLINVKCRHPLLLSNRTELNRTDLEQNRTGTEQEQNGTEGSAPAAPDVVEDEELYGSGPLPPISEAFTMFEKEGFGLISITSKDEIIALVDEYSERWFCEALKKAVLNGRRNLGYVGGILKNWRAGGINEPWTQEKQTASGGGNRTGPGGKPKIEATQNDNRPATAEEIALQQKLIADLKAKQEAAERAKQEKLQRGEPIGR